MTDDRKPTLTRAIPLCPFAGRYRMCVYDFVNDADDTGGSIITGMKKVLAAFPVNKTGTNAIKVEINTDESGTKNGSVKITTTAGDDGSIMCIGFGLAATRS